MLTSINQNSLLKRFGLALSMLLATPSDAFPMMVIPNANVATSSHSPPPTMPQRLDTSISAIAESIRNHIQDVSQQPSTQQRQTRKLGLESDLQYQMMQELLDSDFVRRHDPVEDDELMTSTSLPNLYRAQTLQDYKKIVEDGDKRLTVVHFSAPYCLACKASAPLIFKLAKDMPDVNFVVFSVTKQNRNDVKDKLQVPSLPYAFVHHPTTQEVVEQLSTNKRQMKDFTSVLKSYRTKLCDLSDDADAETRGFASPCVRFQ